MPRTPGDDYLAGYDCQATWIFERIKKMGYPGSFEIVKDYVRSVKERRCRLAYARFDTKPGLQAQIDWGDFQIENPDGSTSVKHMFLMILGYIRAMYIEFVEQCSLETFMECHIRAFHYLQGVPCEILYYNMKQVVVGRKRGKVISTMSFSTLPIIMVFCQKPVPPYSPRVKGKPERPMDYVRQRFWRGYVYTNLEKLNRDAMDWLNETANARCHGTHGQIITERWEQEIPLLGPLPLKDYDTSIKVYRKVYKDCQLS